MTFAELQLPTTLAEVLPKLGQELRRLYGAKLRGLWLFGSHARGQAHVGSDVDVLLVLDDFSDVGEEIDRTSEIRARLSLECGRTVSLVPLRWKDFCTRQTPLVINVRSEGVAL